jgi:hypothetical protein
LEVTVGRVLQLEDKRDRDGEMGVINRRISCLEMIEGLQ